MTAQRRTPKKIGWIVFGILILILLAGYNFLLSQFMIRNLWLPMAERKSGFELEASEISVSLFSSPTLSARDLKVVKKGELEAAFGKVRLEANPLSFLISNKLEISNLEIVKLQMNVRSAAEKPSAEKKTPSAPMAERKEGKKSIEFAIGKVNIYDGSLVFAGEDGRWELNGFSFSASDFMRGASPSVKFTAALSTDWRDLKISNAKLEGGLDMRLPQDTLMPDFVKVALDVGKTTLAFRGASMEIGLSAALNMTKKGEVISISDSRLRISGPDSNELVKGFADASFHLTSHAGKLKMTGKTMRSELTDALFSAMASAPVEGAALETSFSAEIAPGFSEITADGKCSVRGERLMSAEIRALDSKFAFRAAKKGKSVSVSKFDFSLHDGAGKVNMDVALPKKIVFRTSPFAMEQGQIVLRSDRVNLPLLAELSGQKERLPLKSGLLSLMLKLKFGDRSGPCSADGSMTLSGVRMALGNRETAPADLSGGFFAVLDGKRKLLLNGNLVGRTNGKTMLSLDCRAEIPSAWKEKPSVSVSNLLVNQELLSVLPVREPDLSAIRSFRLTGNASWNAVSPEKQNLAMVLTLADFLVSGAEKPMTFRFSSDASFSKTKVEFRKFLLSAFEKEDPFFDLGISGTGVWKATENEKNNLTVSSNYIDAKKIQDLLLALRPVSAPERPESAGSASPLPAGQKAGKGKSEELAPLDLSDYRGVVNFNLAQICYTDDFRMRVSGPLTIEKHAVRIDRWKVTANDAPAALRFRIGTGAADGYPYRGAFSMKNLALPPLIRAFGKGEDSGVTGTFQSLQLNFSGKGMTAPNFKKNLKGSLTASTKDLSFPARSARTIRALDLLMIPLSAIPGLSETVSPEVLPEDLKNLRTTVLDILEGRRNVEFQKGVLKASAASGVITLKEFQFEGGTLKRESVTGTVNLLSETLKLDSVLEIGSLVVPLPIRGSFSKPLPDYKKFLVDFTRRNIKNSLKPENLEKTIQNVDGIINLFKKERKKDR